MLVVPALDLKDGRCVRLRQGDMQAETVYSQDVPGMARRWEKAGARLLHVVDLNGALEGQPRNLSQVEDILKAVSIPVQVGGGIRTIQTLRRYFACGVSRAVLGTAALRDRHFLERASAEFPGRILLGVDARDNKVAVQGWTSLSGTGAQELLQQLAGYSLAGVVYTDIARDGMLGGPNLLALKEMVAHSPFPVIASGGIGCVEDILDIRALGPRVEGVIVGKALYDGKLDLATAMAAAEG